VFVVNFWKNEMTEEGNYIVFIQEREVVEARNKLTRFRCVTWR